MQVRHAHRGVHHCAAAGLVLLQGLLHLRVGHLVDKLGQVLHANLRHRSRNLLRLFRGWHPNSSVFGLKGTVRGLLPYRLVWHAVLSVLNNHVAVNLVDFNGVSVVSLVVDYNFVFELVRVDPALVLLGNREKVNFLDVVVARVLEMRRCSLRRVARRPRIRETFL